VNLHFKNPGYNTLQIQRLSTEGSFRLQDSGLGPHNLELHVVRSAAPHGEEIELSATFVGEDAGRHDGMLMIHTSPAGLAPAAIRVRLHAQVHSFAVTLLDPSPSSVLDLGPVVMGDTKVARVRLRNLGTIDAWLDSYTFSNAQVQPQVGIETGSIAKGQTREYELAFRASTVGLLATDIMLHFTDGIEPPRYSMVVTLKFAASGLGAQGELTPSELHFGMVAVGAQSGPLVVGLRNVGDQVLNVTGMLLGSDFRLIGTRPQNVGPHQTEQLQVAFRPGRGGVLSTSCSIQSNSVNPPLPVSMHGIGVLEPVLHTIPDAVGYGATPVGGHSGTEIVEVRNDGAVTVQLGDIRIAGADVDDFELTATTCAGATLKPEGKCEVRLQFAPASAGSKQTSLEVEYLSAASPLRMPIAGHAIAALGLVPSDVVLDFGGVALGAASTARSLTITNAAVTPATVIGLAFGGADAGDFAIVSDGCTGDLLAPGGSCTIQLSVQPSALGPRRGALTLTGNVPADPVSLSATGIGAQLEWSAPVVDFDVWLVGQTSLRQMVYVLNAGTKPLVVTAIDVVGDFLFQDLAAPYTTIPPKGDRVLWVWFRPTAAGVRQGALRVHSAEPGSPSSLALTGVGLVRP
jgi:hypothetical protein